uniref:ATP synthase complex subunit 8 n=1 Tax=Glandirana tientaiensis TaxID=121168 RepID=A0A0U1XFE5_9NEOB|nr:ATP synthase F0 subunit 8 [Glandirana tientaiensis]AIQ78409.1 ATP synthase F0 subunit 8 [Glandirana tientaiensis]
MPQLNPKPWLFYLVIVWLIFPILPMIKILGHTSMNEPNTKTVKMVNPSWSWPWQ